MSYRIVLACSPEEKAPEWADAFLPVNAAEETIEALSYALAWNLPLQIFTPSEDDRRLQQFIWFLKEYHGMDRDQLNIVLRI